jgi:hypothetical protein
MANNTFYEDKVKVTCVDKDQVVEAEVMQFKDKEFCNAVIAGNKINMRWNGRLYVGNAIGLEFVTDGPQEIVVKSGRGM